MFRFNAKQWVCRVCGYNVVGSRPDACPFCGARRRHLVDSATATRRYHVRARDIGAGVSQLLCHPRLGLAHAAYRIDAEGGSVWIDCPAVFREELDPVDAILFTHKDFIGAANQYREEWGAEVRLHTLDAELSKVSQHCVSNAFDNDFEQFGVRGLHIGGHTPGFTVYLWQDVLFVCDYVYPPGAGMKLNPHGPRDATVDGASKLAGLLAREQPKTVCGYNYVTDFESWQHDFMRLI